MCPFQEERRVRVLENVNDADWSPDGNSLAVCHIVGGRNRIEYPIGTVLEESRGRPPLSLRVSPKGDLLAFFEYDNAVGDFALTVLDLHGKKHVLSRGWRRGRRASLVTQRRRGLVLRHQDRR